MNIKDIFFVDFNSLTIKKKIIIGFSALLIFFLIFSLFLINNIYKIARSQKLTELSLSSIAIMKDCRIIEKDFFLSNDIKLIDKNGTNIGLLKQNLDKIKTQETNSVLISKIDILSKLATNYVESFYKVSDLLLQRGLNDNEGIFGEINQYCKEINEKLIIFEEKETIVKFKNIELLIKDYKNNNIKAYPMKFGEECFLIREQIVENEIINLIELLSNSFYTLVSINDKIDAQIEEFNFYINKIEPFMNSYKEYIDDYINSIIINSIITSIVLFVFLLSLGILSSIITTKGITKPINQITKSTKSIHNFTTDLSQIVDINSGVSINISKTINDINCLIDNQSIALDEATKSLNNLITNIVNISAMANNKKNLLDKLLKDSNITSEQILNLMNFINKLKDSSNAILETSKIIEKVAEQTKVLAVNSGIEASNAGEHGKVLRIVSREIKELSFMTSHNAEIISKNLNKNIELIKFSASEGDTIVNSFSNLLKEIKETTDSTISIINNLESISNFSKSVVTKIKSFEEINHSVKKSSHNLQFMAGNIDKNVKKLMSVKSSTYFAVSEIVDSIKQLSASNKGDTNRA